MSGVANAFIPAAKFDTPLTYEAMQAIGSGLGACGFIVFDDESDLVAVTQAISRFLAVESCGQCTPCKQDGLTISTALDRLRRSAAEANDLETISERLRTVVDGARCALATQQQVVVESALRLFPEQFEAHFHARAAAVPQELVAETVDIADGVARLDEQHLRKQPDWSYDAVDSGQMPADRL